MAVRPDPKHGQGGCFSSFRAWGRVVGGALEPSRSCLWGQSLRGRRKPRSGRGVVGSASGGTELAAALWVESRRPGASARALPPVGRESIGPGTESPAFQSAPLTRGPEVCVGVNRRPAAGCLLGGWPFFLDRAHGGQPGVIDRNRGCPHSWRRNDRRGWILFGGAALRRMGKAANNRPGFIVHSDRRSRSLPLFGTGTAISCRGRVFIWILRLRPRGRYSSGGAFPH